MTKVKKPKQTKANQETVKKKEKGAHWSKTEIATMLKLLEKNVTAAEIAVKLNRPQKSIESKIYRERKKGTIPEKLFEEPVEELVEEQKLESKWQEFFNWVLRTGKERYAANGKQRSNIVGKCRY